MASGTHLQLVFHKVRVFKVGRCRAWAERLFPDDNATLVTQIEKALVLRVVCAPHVVGVHLHQQIDISLDLGQQ